MTTKLSKWSEPKDGKWKNSAGVKSKLKRILCEIYYCRWIQLKHVFHTIWFRWDLNISFSFSFVFESKLSRWTRIEQFHQLKLWKQILRVTFLLQCFRIMKNDKIKIWKVFCIRETRSKLWEPFLCIATRVVIHDPHFVSMLHEIVGVTNGHLLR